MIAKTSRFLLFCLIAASCSMRGQGQGLNIAPIEPGLRFNIAHDKSVYITGVYFRDRSTGGLLWGIEGDSGQVVSARSMQVEYGVVPPGYSSAYRRSVKGASDEMQMLVVFSYDVGAPHVGGEVYRVISNKDSVGVQRETGMSLEEMMPPQYAGLSPWREVNESAPAE